MIIRKRYDQFSELYDLTTAALCMRGVAGNRFPLSKQGELIKAGYHAPDNNPDLSVDGMFGFPQEQNTSARPEDEPRYTMAQIFEMMERMGVPTPRNRPGSSPNKPRP